MQSKETLLLFYKTDRTHHLAIVVSKTHHNLTPITDPRQSQRDSS